MPSAKETYQSSITRGIINPRDSRADLYVKVSGLDGTRSSLDTAIDTAISGRLVHPDDSTLPLRYATARWVRGADLPNSAVALVALGYDKRGAGEATDATEFSNIANISYRRERILWWGDTINVPAVAGTPEAITLQADPMAGNSEVQMPRPHYLNVRIMDIAVPVVLSSSPLDTVDDHLDTVNDGTLTLSDKSFAANTLLFNGLGQRATKIDDGATVTYEFDVFYVFSFRRDGWYRSLLVDDGGEYKADKKLMYPATTFPTFPVS